MALLWVSGQGRNLRAREPIYNRVFRWAWTPHLAHSTLLGPPKSTKGACCSADFPDQDTEAQRGPVTAQGHRLMTEPTFEFRSIWI